MAEVSLYDTLVDTYDTTVNYVTEPIVDAFNRAFAEDETYRWGTWFSNHCCDHTPFYIYRQADTKNQLLFYINPSNAQWSLGTRTANDKVLGGAIHHNYPKLNSDETYFDQPIIQIAFQTGNITPYGHQDDSVKAASQQSLPQGLGNFYDFLSILDSPNTINNNEPNYVNINYVSSIFPNILLRGFFTPEGVTWTDSSDNPYTVMGWGANFEVFETIPALNALDLRLQFATFGFNIIPNKFSSPKQATIRF